MTLRISGGTIVDGTGAPPRRADLTVEAGRIVALGELAGGADFDIDAAGKVIAPGFIDIHSHTDHLLLANPLAESKLLQGVTCEVGGNCGFSAAPLAEGQRQGIADELAPYGLAVDWDDLAGFLARLESSGLGPNFVTLVGHGNLRAQVLGYADRAPRAEERARMGQLADAALAQGACGISAGLIYPPGCYADLAELADLCQTARGRGFFAVHMRDEGAGLLEAVGEVLEVARRAGVALQISHHKVTGRQNWGLVKESIALIGAAREQGQDVTADVYPYTATNTSLSAVLPDWVKEGGTGALLRRLGEPACRRQIAQEWGARATDLARWEEYLVSRTFFAGNKALAGLRVSDICQRWQMAPLETVAQLIVQDEGRTEMMRFGMCEADIAEVLRQPWVMVGSDAGAKDFSGDWGMPHPRGFGTFPRVFAEYVRKSGLLSLSEAVHKMTLLPARRLGLLNRGKIAPGYPADLVIFDPEVIADRATYQQPLQGPVGIDYILVNGVIVAHAGQLTGARPGKVLRR